MIYLDFCQQLGSGQADMPQPEAGEQKNKILWIFEIQTK